MQPMLQVLESELPSNRALPPMGAETNDFIYAYGVEIGYRQCLATLQMMGHKTVLPDEIESTFDETNNNETNG